MKHVCIMKCEFNNRTYRPGEVLDFDPATAPANVLSSFRKLEGSTAARHVGAAAVEPPPPDGELTRAEYMRRLEELKVPFSARARREDLKALYDAAVNTKPLEFGGKA